MCSQACIHRGACEGSATPAKCYSTTLDVARWPTSSSAGRTVAKEHRPRLSYLYRFRQKHPVRTADFVLRAGQHSRAVSALDRNAVSALDRNVRLDALRTDLSTSVTRNLSQIGTLELLYTFGVCGVKALVPKGKSRRSTIRRTILTEFASILKFWCVVYNTMLMSSF